MTDIIIDPNVRVANDETYAGFEDVLGTFPMEGTTVTVREPEAHLIGRGLVTRLDPADRLIYIQVDWATLLPETNLTPDQLVRNVSAVVVARGGRRAYAPRVTSPSQPGQIIDDSRRALTAV